MKKDLVLFQLVRRKNKDARRKHNESETKLK